MSNESTSNSGIFINNDTDINHISLNSGKEKESNSICPPDGRMRHWYNLNHDDLYIYQASINAETYRKSFEKHLGELKEGDKIMEFGCSSGRLIRWFEPEASRGVDVWVVDIDGPAITWAQQNLPSNLNFFMNTTSPHLPFRDDSFNFIFAESVFTHIAELADAWLLELARVMNKDRGLAIISINDERAIENLEKINPPKYNEMGKCIYTGPRKALGLIKDLKEPFGKLTFNEGPWQTGVWYSNEFILSRLNKIFDIIEIIPYYHSMYQTAYILKIK
jgi:SAM-dependent methyltransferase